MGSNATCRPSRQGLSVGFMLAQMGVDSSHTGRGLGSAVLRDAMQSAARAHAEGPFPLFIVDAADDSLVTCSQSCAAGKGL